jgi:phage terminase small subunit
VELSKERVLKEVMRLAFVDIRKLYREDGSLKTPHELDDDTAAALLSMEVFEEYDGHGDERSLAGFTKKEKMGDKKGSLEILMRHLGMLNDKLLHDVDPKSALAALIRQVSGTSIQPVKNPAEGGDV